MKLGIIIFVVLIIGIVGFIVLSGDEQISTIDTSQDTNEVSSTIEWREYELTDINTGETFKISDFKGTPVLLESFAVWCPTCTKQQQEVKKLHDELGDSFISISIDTDPNENANKILEHTQRNGFDWRYAISPSELTQTLIDEFGVIFINAPQAPIVLIDKDQNARILKRGVKSSEELKSELGF